MLAIGVALAVAGENLEVTGDLPENFDKNHPFTLFRTTGSVEISGGCLCAEDTSNCFLRD